MLFIKSCKPPSTTAQGSSPLWMPESQDCKLLLEPLSITPDTNRNLSHQIMTAVWHGAFVGQRFAVSFLIAVKPTLLIESTREARTLISLWRALFTSYTSAETEFRKDQRPWAGQWVSETLCPPWVPHAPSPTALRLFRGQTYKQ